MNTKAQTCLGYHFKLKAMILSWIAYLSRALASCDVISLIFSQDFSSSIYLAWFFPQLSVYFCCYWHQELLLRKYIQLKTEQIKEWKPWNCATILKKSKKCFEFEVRNKNRQNKICANFLNATKINLCYVINDLLGQFFQNYWNLVGNFFQ